MKRHGILSTLVIVALVFLFATQSYYFLDNAEEAVIQRFGEVIKVSDTSGLNFKLPLIDHVAVVNTNEVRRIQYGYRPLDDPTTSSSGTYEDVTDEAIVLTKGSYLVNIGAVIQYRITDPASYILNVDDQLGTIRLAFESVLRRNMQNKDLENALVNKDSIATEILPELSKKLGDYGLGITITEVKFTDVLLPETVQFSYDDVNNAENEKTEYVSKAEKYKNEKLPKARADAYAMIQDAEAYKAEKVSQAKGDVENFNQVYEKYVAAKEITMTRMYVETMEKVLNSVGSKTVLDFDSSGAVKYLPLDPKVLDQGGDSNE